MSPNNLKLTTDFSVSRIIHGLMRLKDWDLSKEKLIYFLENLMEIGVTSFDHADIYKNIDEINFVESIHKVYKAISKTSEDPKSPPIVSMASFILASVLSMPKQ